MCTLIGTHTCKVPRHEHTVVATISSFARAAMIHFICHKAGPAVRRLLCCKFGAASIFLASLWIAAILKSPDESISRRDFLR